jgi:hypothetical protein
MWMIEIGYLVGAPIKYLISIIHFSGLEQLKWLHTILDLHSFLLLGEI